MLRRFNGPQQQQQQPPPPATTTTKSRAVQPTMDVEQKRIKAI